MKQKTEWKKPIVLLCIAVSLAACSDDTIEIESSSATRSFVESVQSNPYSSASKSVSRTENVGSAPAPSEAQASFPAPKSASVEEIARQADDTQKVAIKVIKSDLIETKEIIISDEEQTQQILSFVESMFESDYISPPFTGATVIEVVVIQEGIEQEYSFIDREVDGYRLAKDGQHPDVKNTWHFADPKAYPYLLDLF